MLFYWNKYLDSMFYKNKMHIRLIITTTIKWHLTIPKIKYNQRQQTWAENAYSLAIIAEIIYNT